MCHQMTSVMVFGTMDFGHLEVLVLWTDRATLPLVTASFPPDQYRLPAPPAIPAATPLAAAGPQAAGAARAIAAASPLAAATP